MIEKDLAKEREALGSHSKSFDQELMSPPSKKVNLIPTREQRTIDQVKQKYNDYAMGQTRN